MSGNNLIHKIKPMHKTFIKEGLLSSPETGKNIFIFSQLDKNKYIKKKNKELLHYKLQIELKQNKTSFYYRGEGIVKVNDPKIIILKEEKDGKNSNIYPDLQ